MELLIAAVAAGGVVGAATTWAAVRWRGRSAARLESADELRAARRFAEQDAVLLGEELRRLDTAAAGHDLDEATQADYQSALDAYESALRSVDRMQSTDDVSRVVDTLTSGRFALACVRARLSGEPLPGRRTPCFFNPQHGPAATEIRWTRPGHGTRMVPACAQDAARHAAGERPEVLCLKVNGLKVPYYEVGALMQPYSRGYFPTSASEARRDANAARDLWMRPPDTPLNDPYG